jgi:hypothetical protein
MKRKLMLCAAFLCSVLLGQAQTQINISTGLNATLNGPEAAGNQENWWQMTSSPNPPGTPALVCNHFPNLWQPTPVTGTNAGWINAPGDPKGENLSGLYVFDRVISIPPNAGSLAYNFSVASDDNLVSLEIIDPNAVSTPLNVVSANPYFLSQPISNAINNPIAGTWTIRATVNIGNDGIGGFLASGSMTLNPCRNTYLIRLANAGGTAPGIFPGSGGNFYASGLSGSNTFLLKSDASGNMIWTKEFKLGNGDFQIRDLKEDASGNLLGIANHKNPLLIMNSVIFCYDVSANSFSWITEVKSINYSNLHLTSNNEFIVTGTVAKTSGLPSGTTTFYKTRLERRSVVTGNITSYEWTGEDGDYYSTLVGNTLYGACRRYFNTQWSPNTAVVDYRASVFAHDATTGNFQWQNSIITQTVPPPGSWQTRMYPTAPIVDNNELVVAASGSLSSAGVYTNSSMSMVAAKTDLAGNMIWTRIYIIPAFNRPVTSCIVNSTTGYYIIAKVYLPAPLANFKYTLVVKTDKSGQVQWAKRIGFNGYNICNMAFEQNGSLYLSMTSDSYAPASPNELLLLKLDALGNIDGPCDIVQPVTVFANPMPNIQVARPYTEISDAQKEVTPQAIPFAVPPRAFIQCEVLCVKPRPMDEDIAANKLAKVKPVQFNSDFTPLLVTPNPAFDLTTLSLPVPAATNTVVRLSDLSGRQLRQWNWPAGSRQLNIRLGAMAPGSYVAEVWMNGRRYATAQVIRR